MQQANCTEVLSQTMTMAKASDEERTGVNTVYIWAGSPKSHSGRVLQRKNPFVRTKVRAKRWDVEKPEIQRSYRKGNKQQLSLTNKQPQWN